MSIFLADLIQTLEELEPPLRRAFIKVLQKIEQVIGENVRREDFLELKNIVREIAEIQRRTDEKLEKIEETQRETQEVLRQLAEEQKKACRSPKED